MRSNSDRAVSNIIGVMLLLALVVSMIAIITPTILTAVQIEDKPRADIDYNQNEDTLVINHMGNTDTIRVEYSDGGNETFTDVGRYELTGTGNPYTVYGIKDSSTSVIRIIES